MAGEYSVVHVPHQHSVSVTFTTRELRSGLPNNTRGGTQKQSRPGWSLRKSRTTIHLNADYFTAVKCCITTYGIIRVCMSIVYIREKQAGALLAPITYLNFPLGLTTERAEAAVIATDNLTRLGVRCTKRQKGRLVLVS